MTHTSGIRDFLDAGLAGSDGSVNDAVVEWVAADPSAHRDADSFEYSNTNYNLLAEIVERAVGEPFDEWMQTHVFSELEVEARFWPALPTDPVGHLGSTPVSADSPQDDLGSGGIIITPSELVRWGGHIRRSALVSAETFDAALQRAVPVTAGAAYGPGLIVVDNGSLDHGGLGEGVFTAFSVSPDRHTVIAVTCNTSGHAPAVDAQLRAVWGLPESSGL